MRGEGLIATNLVIDGAGTNVVLADDDAIRRVNDRRVDNTATASQR
jgi:hypothetical protein